MKTNPLILIFLSFILQGQVFSQTSNYVKIEGQKFVLNGKDYYPVAVNYLLQITKNHTNNTYYLSPNWNYSNLWGIPDTGGERRYIYSTTDDIGISHNKLVNDISKMRGRGINTVRIMGLNVFFKNGSISYPNECSETVYFEKIEEILNLLQTFELKAILLIGAPMDAQYDMVYIDFLNRLSTYFKNKTSLMGYDFLNEPNSFIGGKQKFINSSRISNWHYSIKKNAPDHLTTIGYSYTIAAIIDWDPALHPVDFASFHIYAWSKDVQLSKNVIASSLKWYCNTINKPWIVGEIGYSGTNDPSVNNPRVGTESQQKDFADFTMQKALDCHCCGYTWWQFQEINWDTLWEKYLGLITPFDNNQPNNGEREKAAMLSFKNFNPNSINVSNCVKPSNYYNMWGKTYLRNQGRVLDNQGNPTKDAVIDRSGITFSNENGYFKYYTEPTGNYYTLSVTAPGYSVVQFPNPGFDVGVATLFPINYLNCWMKRWSNNKNDMVGEWTINSIDKYFNGDFDGNGKDELLCVQNTSKGKSSLFSFNNGWMKKWTNNGDGSLGEWIFCQNDKFLIGDFNGDGKDELLCIQDNEQGRAVLFEFNDDNGQWSVIWTNNTNGWLSGWKIRQDDKFITGDFNGDGKDDLMCITNSDNGWASVFSFFQGQWLYMWSNYGNGWIGEWKIRTIDIFYCGDFNGNGKADLFCVQNTGGDKDWMTLLSFNGSWGKLWSNRGSSSFGIYPYRNRLIVGNFDTDGSDELLGINSWATKFDFNNSNWIWNWSTEHSKMLGDWDVNPNNSILFYKANLTEPEYLMIISQNTSSDFCNMYLMNPIGNTKRINTYCAPFSVYGATIDESNDWDVQDMDFFSKDPALSKNHYFGNDNLPISVFPNPINSIANVILSKDTAFTIELIDMRGKLIKSFKDIEKSLVLDCSDINSGIYLLKVFSSDELYQQKVVISK